MRAISISIFTFLIISMLLPQREVGADAAPPTNPHGGNVLPEGDTQVQMVAEQVLIDFRQSTDDSANVTAWFLFHNTGSADEHLKVRFPLSGDPRETDSGQLNYPMIQNFTALIDGQQLPTQVIEDDDPNESQFFMGYGSQMFWSEFNVDFPVGKDVKLDVKYTFQPTWYPNDQLDIVYYILSTGAGWKDPIGKADVIMRFPYILSPDNLPYFDDFSSNTYFTNDAPSDSTSLRSTAIYENELWFHWENLEPSVADNVRVGVVQPQRWQAVLQRRIQVVASPDDASSWLALARAYRYAGDINQEFIQAFERALTLNPDNASLHAEFANDMLVANRGGSSDYYKEISLNELAIALTLDPKNVDALNALDRMNQIFPDAILPTPGPFPIDMTATPTLEPTAVPTSYLPSPTPQSTLTQPSNISLQPTTLPTKEPNGTDFELPGFAILLAFVFAAGTGSGILINRHKRK